MGNYKNKWLSLLVGLSLLSGAAISSEVVLEPVKALPVDKELLTVTGDPVSVIETGIITDENGVAARGPHEISFTLDENAPYGVVVGGETVLPGETKVLVKNLTTSDHKLTLPVYPMVPGIEGVASYSIDIPQIKVEACPSGFTETPNDCYKVTYSTIEYECPNNSEYQEDTLDCRKTEESAVVEYCDAPFVKQNGKCVQEFTVAANQECPTDIGWSQDGDICRYLDVKPIESCPDGYYFTGGKCHLITDKSDACPANYALVDGICEKDDSVPASETCPDEFTMQEGNCVKITTEPVVQYCPPGYVDNGWDGCSKQTIISATETCELGKAGYGECRVYYSETTYHNGCSGFQFQPFNDGSDRGICYKHDVISTSIMSCPDDHVPLGVDQCVKKERLSYFTSCQAGYTLNDSNTLCVKNIIENAIYACPQELELTGVTCGDGVTKASLVCPSSYVESNGECVKTTTTLANFSCGDGYSPMGSQCVKRENVCASGSTYQPLSNNCLRINTFGPSHSTYCPTGWGGGSICTITTSENLINTCQNGSIDNTGICSTPSPTPPSYTCQNGWALSGSSCSFYETDSATYRCPSDAQQGASCNKISTKEPILACAGLRTELNQYQCYSNVPDTSKGNCAIDYSLNPTPFQCEEHRSQEVEWSCPEGPYSLNKPNCEYYEDAPVKATCTSDGALVDVDDYVCKELIIENTEFVCEPGFVPVPSEARCVKEETSPFI